ncbi:MAG: TonB-dependent receptor domain-containing protein [Candidatus Acidiferrales bacterium]
MRLSLNNRMFFRFLAVAFAVVLGAGLMYGQAVNGSISGSVIDAQGGAVVGAKIVITNLATGVVTNSESSSAGAFFVKDLPPGVYSVRITQQGFKAREYQQVTVELNKDTSLTVSLEVGDVSQTVTVESVAPIVETTTAQTTTTFETKKITDLPAVTGRLDSIALLSPGVIPGFGNVNSNGATLSVDGQRARSNNFTIDGQDNNDNSIGGPGLFESTIDFVQELSIVTNNFSAEYGRNQGAQVNIVTRSGTNDIHGALTAFFQSDGFNANSFSNDLNGTPKSHFNNNDDDASIGGPIKKDKIFYFLGFEYQKEPGGFTATSSSSTFTITPKGIATLNAAFPNSIPVQVYGLDGPLTRAIGGPAILAGSEGNCTQELGKRKARCQVGTLVNGVAIPDFDVARITRTIPNGFTFYNAVGKMDFHIGSNTTLSARYLGQDQLSDFGGGASVAGYTISVPARSQNIGVTLTHQFSPRQVNEFRLAYGRLSVHFQGGNTFGFGQITNNIANVSMPASFQGFGLPTNLPQFRVVNTYQLVDNYSIQIGRHALKTGIDMRRQLTPDGFLPDINGLFVFSSMAGFIGNNPSSFTGASGSDLIGIRETDSFVYFQDDFKVKPNLTLNLGLRYEYTGQPNNILNKETVQRESNPATAIWNTALPLSARTVPALNAAKLDFAPRFGFAYTPHWGNRLFGQDNTVIRGGYSIAYDPDFFNLLLNVGTAAPTVLLFTLPSKQIPGGKPPGMPSTDITGANLHATLAPPAGLDPRIFNQTQFSSTFKSPYAQNWTLGMQRRIGQNMGFEIRYAGSRGVALFQSFNGNPCVSCFINAGFGSLVPSGIVPAANGRVNGTFNLVRTRGNAAQSTYHGLQTRFDGRLFHQVTLGASYTYSHNIDNSSEVFNFTGQGSVAIQQNPFNINGGERGNSNIDFRHVGTANFIWDIPAYKSQSGFIGHILGGWETTGILRLQTGRPITPLCAVSCGGTVDDTSFNAAFFGILTSTRPFAGSNSAPVGSVADFSATCATSLVNVVSGACVTRNQVQFVINDGNTEKLFGTPFGVGRNNYFGPNLANLDFGLFKNIKITERFSGQLRLEAENVFNHPSLATPDVFIDDVGSTFFSPQLTGNTVIPSRTITIGARILF